MRFELCTVKTLSKGFVPLGLNIGKDYFGMALLTYYKAIWDSGFGLLNISIGKQFEKASKFNITIKFLWWEFSWTKGTKDEKDRLDN